MLAALVCVTGEMQAQLFDEGEPSLGDYRSLGIGACAQSFRPLPGNPEADSGKIRIRTPLWLAEFRQMGLRIALGFSSYTFDNTSRSELTIGAESITDISLAGNPERSNFFLPIIFSTNYVQATGATNSTKDFNIADLGVGTGLKFKQVGESYAIQMTGVGIIYYSSAGFSLQSGSSTAAIAELQVLFRGVVGEGMTAGYRYEFQRWTMSDATLNYVRQIHGPFVGIFF